MSSDVQLVGHEGGELLLELGGEHVVELDAPVQVQVLRLFNADKLLESSTAGRVMTFS